MIDSVVTRQAARSAAFLSLLLSSLVGALFAPAPAATMSSRPPLTSRGTTPAAAQTAILEASDHFAVSDEGKSSGDDGPAFAAFQVSYDPPAIERSSFGEVPACPPAPLSCGFSFDARAPPAS